MNSQLIEQIICDITVLEFVPNTINPNLPPMELRRSMITVPVEGYNWVSPKCVYYKSSGISNASTDKPDERLVRQYMWFPTVGLVQQNSLIDLMFKCIGSEKINGFFIKNLRVDLRTLYESGVLTLTNFETKILDGIFGSYNKYVVSPYLEFLREVMPSTTVTNEIFNTEIALFNVFISIMSQYCYNWKQVQYSVRVSSRNIVNDVTLLMSKFKNVCLFILNYDLEGEFGRTPTWKKLETPLTPISVTFSQTMHSSGDPIVINNLLSNQLAVNNELIITPQNPDMSKEDIKTIMTPFKNTLILGKPFVEETVYSNKSGTKKGGKTKRQLKKGKTKRQLKKGKTKRQLKKGKII